MSRYRLFQFGGSPWTNGLRLALLNAGLAIFCIVSFLGTLFVVTSLSRRRFAGSGDPSTSVPFPYPVLLLAYGLMFLLAWAWCGRRLPGSRPARLQAALIGALPLLGLSLLGYLGVGAMLVWGDFAGQGMLEAGVFIYGAIATLILLAGLTSVGLIFFSGGRGATREPL